MGRPLTWILHQQGDDLVIVAGPIPTEQEEMVENAMVAVLKQDGIKEDDSLNYILFERDSSGAFEANWFEDEYWEWIVARAEGKEDSYGNV